MTTPKLEPGTPLPCPFCGGEPKRLNDGQGMSIFQCQKCTACHIRTFNNEAAFERWNTRHPDPRQQEKIEAAYAECRKLDASLELLGDERDKALEKIEALVKALEKYGEHASTCPCSTKTKLGRNYCTCGFDDTLAEAK